MRPLSLSLVLAGLVPVTANATCSITRGATADAATVQLQFGRVSLPSTHLQPVGSLLGSTIAFASSRPGWNAETVLWTCAKSDLPNIHFLVATNGDDRVGGYWEIGNGHGSGVNDGLPGVYATYFQYVGIRQRMADVVLSRYWQKVPVDAHDVSGDNILIKAKHIPPLVAELFRVSSLPPGAGSGSMLCGVDNVVGVIATGPYSCLQPNSYIQLSGSAESIPFWHDGVGEDSNTNHVFWSVNNGYGYGMRGGATLSRSNTCVARSVDPVVTFAPISVPELIRGDSRQASFVITLECNSTGVGSGVRIGQTALGIQVSQAAYRSAVGLGLVNASNGVTHLVSDDYGSDNALAKGVGIGLRNSESAMPMNFLGWPLAAGGGGNAGWYPVLAGAAEPSTSVPGHAFLTQTLTATLARLPGQAPTPGKIHATAYVLVKMQ